MADISPHKTKITIAHYSPQQLPHKAPVSTEDEYDAGEEMTTTFAPTLNPAKVTIRTNSTSEPNAQIPATALNLTPALFILGMLFTATILAVVAQASMIAFLTGIAAAIMIPVFAFVDLYMRLQH